MSDVDHAGIIYTLTDALKWNYINPDSNKARMELVDGFDTISDHAESLQRERDEARAELAAERARVDRLQTYGLCIREELLTRYPEYADIEKRVVQSAYLQPGDLPDDDEGEVTT